jgi:MmyB-like transcription regulator ligand binding domain
MTERGTSAGKRSGRKTRYHLLTTDGGIVADQPSKAAGEAAIGGLEGPSRNFVRLLFTDPRLRSPNPEWEELARAVVSYMRMEAACKPDDPRPGELVGDLSIRDA